MNYLIVVAGYGEVLVRLVWSCDVKQSAAFVCAVDNLVNTNSFVKDNTHFKKKENDFL